VWGGWGALGLTRPGEALTLSIPAAFLAFDFPHPAPLRSLEFLSAMTTLPLFLFPVLLAAVLLLAAAISDVRGYRIPNLFSLNIALLFPVYGLLSGQPVAWGAHGFTMLGCLAVGLPLFALKLAGGGDVKLLTALALWAGPGQIAPLLLITAVLGGVLALGAVGLTILRQPALLYGLRTVGLAPFRSIKLPYGVAIAGGGLAILAPLLP
jgi:prepilin peptidase CpaA